MRIYLYTLTTSFSVTGEDITFQLGEFAHNPTPRVPIALVLDTSGSMQGEPIAELNEGLKLFVEELKNDEIASSAAEVCVVTFGGEINFIDFTPISSFEPVEFTAGGETPMGAAVLTALDLLERRKFIYKEAGVDYYQPWMVLMTDGMPTDSISHAVERVQTLLRDKKLVVFPIAVGPNASIPVLEKFTIPKRPPLRLKEYRFREFFTWLSKSVASVSRSVPGEAINLADGLEGWARID